MSVQRLSGRQILDKSIKPEDLDLSGMSGFRAYPRKIQTISKRLIWQRIVFKTVEFDNQNEYDTTSSSFIAKEAGVYMVNFRVTADQMDSQALFRNGTLYEVGNTHVVHLQSGDYIEVYAIFSNKGVEISSVISETYFSALKVM